MEPNRTRTLALVAALMLVTAVALPAAVTASDHSLSIDVDQQRDSGEALVTVTDGDGDAVENATVSVNESANYSIDGDNTTDENGTVLLPAPNETVDVTLTAEHNGSNVSESVELVALNESLEVQVDQTDAQKPTVTVTQYEHAVENATVNVTVDDENASYDGAGEHTTDENGSVALPAPNETVDVTVTATDGELSAETTATLAGPGLGLSAWQGDDGRLYAEVTYDNELVDTASISVEAVEGNYTYDGSGYTASNGTLSLPAPDENVTVNVTAEYEYENDTLSATETVDLDASVDDRPDNFGQTLVKYIEFIKGQNIDGPLGQEISAFVHENNPAADKEPGPPDHVTEENNSNASQNNGPPAHVTDENESNPGQGNGPGAHVNDAGNESDDDDEPRGPPGNGNGNGNGNGPGNSGQGNGPP